MSQSAERDLSVYVDTSYTAEVSVDRFQEHLQQGHALLHGINELKKKQHIENKGFADLIYCFKYF